MASMILSGKTSYGTIGLDFNKESQTWGIPHYKRFLTCLRSCFPDPQDFKQLPYVFHQLFGPTSDPSLSRLDEMENRWSQISEETSQ
jgi:hypothetical protein